MFTLIISILTYTLRDRDDVAPVLFILFFALMYDMAALLTYINNFN